MLPRKPRIQASRQNVVRLGRNSLSSRRRWRKRGGPCGIQRTGGREERTAPRSPPAHASEATAVLATSESPDDHWLAPGARRAPEKRKTAVRRDAHTPARVASTCSRSPPPLRVEVILPPARLEARDAFSWCVCVCM